MPDSRPVFIVGTGRCGTRSLYKMLAGTAGVEIHHEYDCTNIQKMAALHYMGEISTDTLKAFLETVYGAALEYTDATLWIDSSNKASWIIRTLHELYPDARFVLLLRDGRKVVSSFFNKLAAEIYDDSSVSKLSGWLADPGGRLPPPPEKKYWWNIPRPGQPFHDEFPGYNQFQRICYHWVNCNRFVLEQFAGLPPSSWIQVKLEEICQDMASLQVLTDFIGLPFDTSWFEALQTPQNVFFPMDFQLTDHQLTQFRDICEPMMERLGYAGTDSYVVRY